MLTICTGNVIILTDIFNSRKGDVPMKTLKKILSFVLCIAMVGAFAVMPAGAVKADIAPIGTKGSFNALSYNVKGLPIPATITTLTIIRFLSVSSLMQRDMISYAHRKILTMILI